MTVSLQHVWLAKGVTAFVAPCEVCLSSCETLAARHCVVRGRLEPVSDVGFCPCARGHRVVVRRVDELAATGSRGCQARRCSSSTARRRSAS